MNLEESSSSNDMDNNKTQTDIAIEENIKCNNVEVIIMTGQSPIIVKFDIFW